MIEYQKAKVIAVKPIDENIDEVILETKHNCKRAYNYRKMMGDINVGNIVLINTTACSLNLGTGGYHFIMANLDNLEKQMSSRGHGMKLKYTPQQAHVLFCEEDDSPYHFYFQETINFKARIIYVAELHSMLLPLCSYLKYHRKNIKISCIITDHGALPVFFSKNVRTLKASGLLDSTISIGNAYGGDYECVNIYTGLQMALNTLKSDIVIITMGPGIMGTNTPFGFSGLEMGFYVNFISNNGGHVIYIPRISFTDIRKRHYGLSHHTINTLTHIVDVSIPLVFPIMNKDKIRYIIKQLRENGLTKTHPIIFNYGKDILKILKHFNFYPETMGRSIREERDFFYTIGAAGKYGLSLLPINPIH